MSIELLEGAYDLHVHTGPDLLSRKLDDLDYAERIRKIGMKGFGIKSHHSSSAGRAKLVNKLYPDVSAVGTICLNNAVGGLNPLAVEMAARDGVRIVWMPTFDALNEQEHFKSNKPEKLPHWAKMHMELQRQGKTMPTLTILENGEVKQSVKEIVDIVAQYRLVLATGHLSKQEIFALAKVAKDQKADKFVVTHPNFPSIRLSKEEQKELVQIGARMEYCFTTPHSNKTTWEAVYEEIRFVGPENGILSTDLGQPNGPFPDEGLLEFVTNLRDNGFTREQIKTMTVINTSYLVEG